MQAVNGKPADKHTLSPSGAAAPLLLRASEVVCRQLEWLWPGRVPLGKLTLLAGDPGQGKSFLTLDMAARVSRGRHWPDQSSAPRGSVLILSSEDDPDDTIVPRLKQAGADLDRCLILRAARGQDGLARPLALDRDLGMIRQVLLDNPDCRLIVIDPITAYLGQVDGNNNASLRTLLFPLGELAAERNVAVVMVSHLNKRSSAKALYRAMGSLAFVAVSRSAWLIVRDGKEAKRRMMLSLKANLHEPCEGLAFQLAAPDKQAIARLDWDPEPLDQTVEKVLDQTARVTLRERQYRDQEHSVDTWLREQLSGGPCKRNDLWLQALADGVNMHQMYRAAHRVGVVMHKNGLTWDDAEWMLPEHAERRPERQPAQAPAKKPAASPARKSAPVVRTPYPNTQAERQLMILEEVARLHSPLTRAERREQQRKLEARHRRNLRRRVAPKRCSAQGRSRQKQRHPQHSIPTNRRKHSLPCADS